MKRVFNILSSTPLGLVILGAIVVYLGIFSVLDQLAPRVVVAMLGTAGSGIYNHPVLVVLGALLAINILLTTVLRTPGGLAGAGAWACHLGSVTVIAGAIWYMMVGQSGLALSQLQMIDANQSQWTPIDRFYLDDTFAIHAYGGQGDLRITRLPDLTNESSHKLDLQLASPMSDVQVTAKRYFIGYSRFVWRDNSPNDSPAIALKLEDRRGSRSVVVTPWQPAMHVVKGVRCPINYEPDVLAAKIDEFKQLATTMPAAPGAPELLLARGENVPLQLLTLGGGRPSIRPAAKGSVFEVDVAGETLKVTIEDVMEHAWGSLQELELLPEEAAQQKRRLQPLVEVEVRCGDWTTATCLAFDDFAENAYQSLPLPNDRSIKLAFSRQSRPLGAQVQITAASHERYKGTRTTKDYRCDVDVITDWQKRSDVISYNHPLRLGRYQLSQNSWYNDPVT